jgi:hypothetical protein
MAERQLCARPPQSLQPWEGGSASLSLALVPLDRSDSRLAPEPTCTSTYCHRTAGVKRRSKVGRIKERRRRRRRDRRWILAECKEDVLLGSEHRQELWVLAPVRNSREPCQPRRPTRKRADCSLFSQRACRQKGILWIAMTEPQEVQGDLVLQRTDLRATSRLCPSTTCTGSTTSRR